MTGRLKNLDSLWKSLKKKALHLYNQDMNNKEAAEIRKQALKESRMKILSLNIKIKQLEANGVTSQEKAANRFLQELYYEIFT